MSGLWKILAGGLLFAMIAYGAWILLFEFSDPLSDLRSPRTVASKDLTVPTEDSRIADAHPADDHLFVGSDSCRECHADLCDSYSQMAMARSFSQETIHTPPVESISDHIIMLGKKADDPGQFQYLVRYDDEEQRHVEQLLDARQEIVYELSRSIPFTVGSGTRGYSFFWESHGNLFQSPLTWYSEAEKWSLAPGYEKNNHRFTRRISDGCIHCHVGRVNHDPTRKNHFLKPIVLEAGIGCERCHGPGAPHIEWHRSGKVDFSDQPDPIVNPAKLESLERSAVCYQCHTSPDQRVVRKGRSAYDFRPGDRLSETWVLFSQGTGIDKNSQTRAVGQVDQMHESKCFQSSKKTWFGCTTCHDPHQNPPTESRVEYYRTRCLECHRDNQSVCSFPLETRLRESHEDSCIQCHMPKLPASDVAHTSLTDHRILRDPSSVLPDGNWRQTVAQIMNEKLIGEVPDEAKERAQILIEVPEALESGNRFKARELEIQLAKLISEDSNDAASILNLGLLLKLQGKTIEAEKKLLKVLELDSHEENALQELLDLYHNQERYTEANNYADRLLALNPSLADAWGRKAHILGRMGQINEGIEAAEKAVSLDPSITQIHSWLVGAYREVGNFKQAAKHEQLVEKLTPSAK